MARQMCTLEQAKERARFQANKAGHGYFVYKHRLQHRIEIYSVTKRAATGPAWRFVGYVSPDVYKGSYNV